MRRRAAEHRSDVHAHSDRSALRTPRPPFAHRGVAASASSRIRPLQPRERHRRRASRAFEDPKARARSLRTSRRLRDRSGRTGPGDPCRPASQAPPTEERNRLAAPHGGRMTVVPILEWWRRLARERGKEVASCLPAHPFCRRRHPGHARLVWIEAPELATQGVSSALCQGAAISTPSAPPPITAKESRAARFAGSVSRSADSTASRIRRRSSNASDCLCSTLRLSAPKPCPCCGLLHGQATHAWGSPEAMLHHAGSSRLIPGWVYRSSMRKMQPWSVSERMSRPAA